MTGNATIEAIDLARECLYRFLAGALSDPCGARFALVTDRTAQELALQASEHLRANAPADSEALRCEEIMAWLAQPREDLAAEYQRVFGFCAGVFPPFESEFFPNKEPFFRAQQMADVAGFYGAFGLRPIRSEGERVDHIALELEFMALLLAKRRLAGSEEERAVCESASANFFRDHLGWWAPAFARGLQERGDPGFYASVGRTLSAFLMDERRRWPVEPARVPLPVAEIDPRMDTDCAVCSV